MDNVDIVKLLTAFDIMEKVIEDTKLTWEVKHRIIMLDGIRAALEDADAFLADTLPDCMGTDQTEVLALYKHYEQKVNYLKEIKHVN